MYTKQTFVKILMQSTITFERKGLYSCTLLHGVRLQCTHITRKNNAVIFFVNTKTVHVSENWPTRCFFLYLGMTMGANSAEYSQRYFALYFVHAALAFARTYKDTKPVHFSENRTTPSFVFVLANKGEGTTRSIIINGFQLNVIRMNTR